MFMRQPPMTEKQWFLVTTSDKRSWREKVPLLILGEWCVWNAETDLNTYPERKTCEPYGLKEGQRDRDRIYLDSLYEELLAELAESLNGYHGIGFTKRFWRIVLGTWLCRFTTIVFNRWATIHQAVENDNIAETIVLDFPLEHAIPVDYLDFARMNRIGDWDHMIYGKILKESTNVFCTSVPVDDVSTDRESFTFEPGTGVKKYIKGWVIWLGNRLSFLMQSLVSNSDNLWIF